MPWLTQLAAVARRTGYPVVECSGWRTRGHGPQPAVQGVVAHHTAGWDDLHVVRDGRPGLEGPLSQIWLRRDGTIFIVAAGRCWHNAPSISANHTNSNSIGIEAENDGRAPWPEKQLDSYKRLCAELCKEFDLPPSRVKGHKEVNTSKIDPHSINMGSFRTSVALLMTGTAFTPAFTWTEKLVKALPLLRPGDENWDVKTLRWLLGARGFPPQDLLSQKYDPDLKAGVIAFQKAEKLTPDSIIGEKTWAALLRR
ncbi:N-acetylmuramoyl-L-alanine amidase [Sphaerisporangium sp. TRM90804]|uniref:peptidoglycan recognition protein family protein n=1 Tax=Sphaerisporangium sp. TRM90804 TaxID=3031113 RepID=UPI00244BFFB6|nr:N-acetylmuramoyl-L-alanine amidase [Sphaerisporangium sp. TRM90804]MDH2424721.1 N-acetylmuramoyl-L-alanine amidase [Sphaerisporangium sp. TRM90804]